MNWKIITVGKPGFVWSRQAVDEYLRRISRYTKVEHVIIREGAQDQVEAAFDQASPSGIKIVLDERGRALRSTELARWIEARQLSGSKSANLFIGGAAGHSAPFRERADECWSLSALTLQHDIALIVLVEQIYRAYTILKKEPYHRE